MDYYFLTITIIDVFVLSVMCYFTKSSDALNKRQRFWFIRSFVLIIVISVLELITILVDQKHISFRWINIAANYLGFGLTPAIPIFLACALEKKRSMKYAVTIELVYLLFLAVTFPKKLIFYVDASNHYMRGQFFWLYLAVYILSTLYLLIKTLQVTAAYQNSNKTGIYLISIFLLLGTMIQVIFPQIHVSWLCVSLLSILYYTYCSAMWQQLDALTGLLNQKSYLNQTSLLSQGGTLVVFDVDNFKQINDTYGHPMGDRCLKEIAACIKQAYARDGFCYRTGGDEFCVLLREQASAKRCYRQLLAELSVRRTAFPILPHVSVGCAPFAAGDKVMRVKETADANMYQFKKAQKAENIRR